MTKNTMTSRKVDCLTKAGQRKYSLVTQAPQYKAFNEQRFTPSDEAVKSVNNLQSTEWSVDLEMAEIAKTSNQKSRKGKDSL